MSATLEDLRAAVAAAADLPDDTPVLVHLPDGAVTGLDDAGPDGTCDGTSVFRLHATEEEER